jgi:hypothetical protein
MYRISYRMFSIVYVTETINEETTITTCLPKGNKFQRILFALSIIQGTLKIIKVAVTEGSL